MSVEKEVYNLIENPIKNLGYNKIEVSFKKESGTNYLRVFIDKDDVVSLDDIVKVNDLISPILDEADLISSEYILDVSSFGAEKKIDLERLDHYVGKYVNLHLVNPVNGENYFEGTLKEVTDNEVKLVYKIKTRDVEINLNRANIDKARLAIKF